VLSLGMSVLFSCGCLRIYEGRTSRGLFNFKHAKEMQISCSLSRALFWIWISKLFDSVAVKFFLHFSLTFSILLGAQDVLPLQ
jgi:hypothetical protein